MKPLADDQDFVAAFEAATHGRDTPATSDPVDPPSGSTGEHPKYLSGFREWLGGFRDKTWSQRVAHFLSGLVYAVALLALTIIAIGLFIWLFGMVIFNTARSAMLANGNLGMVNSDLHAAYVIVIFVMMGLGLAGVVWLYRRQKQAKQEAWESKRNSARTLRENLEAAGQPVSQETISAVEADPPTFKKYPWVLLAVAVLVIGTVCLAVPYRPAAAICGISDRGSNQEYATQLNGCYNNLLATFNQTAEAQKPQLLGPMAQVGAEIGALTGTVPPLPAGYQLSG